MTIIVTMAITYQNATGMEATAATIPTLLGMITAKIANAWIPILLVLRLL